MLGLGSFVVVHANHQENASVWVFKVAKGELDLAVVIHLKEIVSKVIAES